MHITDMKMPGCRRARHVPVFSRQNRRKPVLPRSSLELLHPLRPRAFRFVGRVYFVTPGNTFFQQPLRLLLEESASNFPTTASTDQLRLALLFNFPETTSREIFISGSLAEALNFVRLEDVLTFTCTTSRSSSQNMKHICFRSKVWFSEEEELGLKVDVHRILRSSRKLVTTSVDASETSRAPPTWEVESWPSLRDMFSLRRHPDMLMMNSDEARRKHTGERASDIMDKGRCGRAPKVHSQTRQHSFSKSCQPKNVTEKMLRRRRDRCSSHRYTRPLQTKGTRLVQQRNANNVKHRRHVTIRCPRRTRRSALLMFSMNAHRRARPDDASTWKRGGEMMRPHAGTRWLSFYGRGRLHPRRASHVVSAHSRQTQKQCCRRTLGRRLSACVFAAKKTISLKRSSDSAVNDGNHAPALIPKDSFSTSQCAQGKRRPRGARFCRFCVAGSIQAAACSSSGCHEARRPAPSSQKGTYTSGPQDRNSEGNVGNTMHATDNRNKSIHRRCRRITASKCGRSTERESALTEQRPFSTQQIQNTSSRHRDTAGSVQTCGSALCADFQGMNGIGISPRGSSAVSIGEETLQLDEMDIPVEFDLNLSPAEISVSQPIGHAWDHGTPVLLMRTCREHITGRKAKPLSFVEEKRLANPRLVLAFLPAMLLGLSAAARHWHYKTWQRATAGYLRTFMRNKLPNNEMIGYVINDKHPKSIRVACDKYMYVVRYKKTFRYTKKVWAHDEDNEARLGDVVRIQPLGYRIGPWKNYLLVRVIHKEPRD